jgi:plastocyanin domain-containing protein
MTNVLQRFPLMALCVIGGLLGAAACDDVAEAPAVGEVRHAIEVDAQGYHPDRIEARAGEPVTLVFTRTTEQGCGGELVIPDHDIERDLPVNEPVEVTFTPAAGEVSFTCGMGMYQGAVVVR